MAAYEPVDTTAAGRPPRRVLKPFLWLLFIPAVVLVSLLLAAPAADDDQASTMTAPGDGPGSSGANLRRAGRPLPPPRAALTSFLQEHLMVNMAAEAMPSLDAPMFGGKPAAARAATAAAAMAAASAAAAVPKAAPAEAEPVVFDVVYCVNLPEDTSFFRIDYGEIEALFRQTVRHLLPATDNTTATTTPTPPPTVRFHLLSNDDEAIRRMRTLHPALRLHDYRLATPSNRSEAFLQSYIHQSTNPPEMERLCMWRWIAMADYFKQLAEQEGESGGEGGGGGGKPRLILGIDTDVGLFQDPSRLLSAWKLQHWEDRGFEVHQIALGAAMLWSPKGLDSFATFIGDLYTSPEEAGRRVKKWGATQPHCRPQRSLLLPCDANATKPEMWHMSDMDLLRAWILQDTSIRTRKEEERCIVVRQAKRASGLRLFLRPNPDVDDGNNTKAAMPILMGIRPGGSGSGSTNETATEMDAAAAPDVEEVCMLHFQGPKSKQLIVPFEAFLEGGTGAGADGKKNDEEEFVLP